MSSEVSPKMPIKIRIKKVIWMLLTSKKKSLKETRLLRWLEYFIVFSLRSSGNLPNYWKHFIQSHFGCNDIIYGEANNKTLLCQTIEKVKQYATLKIAGKIKNFYQNKLCHELELESLKFVRRFWCLCLLSRI